MNREECIKCIKQLNKNIKQNSNNANVDVKLAKQQDIAVKIKRLAKDRLSK